MVIPNVMEVVDWGAMFDSIRLTIRSIANSSFMIMGFFLIVGIVINIAKHYFKHMDDIDKGVKKRSLSREIFRADVDRNVNDIIFNKNLEREINLNADQKFYTTHRKSLVDSSLRKKELGLEVNKMFEDNNRQSLVDASLRKKELGLEVNKMFEDNNRKSLIDSSLRKKELGLDIDKMFDDKNRQSLVDAAVRKKEINHEADLLFHEKNPDAYGEKKDLYSEKNSEYYKNRKGKR